MSSFQNSKSVFFQAGPIATDATSATTVDTLGFKRAVLTVATSPATAGNSNAKWTSLVIQHGTTTDASNSTAIDGLTGTTEATATTSQFVLPVHNDIANLGLIRFNIDLTDKERYLRVVKQAAASHHTSVNSVELWRGGASPDSASDHGAGAVVSG